jgi:hypothetical protein
MEKNKLLYFSLLVAVASSCTTFNETHYFKDKIGAEEGQTKNKVSNYYRVKIKGYSFFSSSRYVSGYFNQDAINLYFNEIKQPENAKLFNTPKDCEGKPVLTNEDGNELVLVLSTNAKAITEQIGNIAKNQTILNSIAQITQKEKINESLAVKSELGIADLDIQNFILNTDLYLKDIESKSEKNIDFTLNQYIKSLTK